MPSNKTILPLGVGANKMDGHQCGQAPRDYFLLPVFVRYYPKALLRADCRGDARISPAVLSIIWKVEIEARIIYGTSMG
jgi:hypothetical protein